MFTYANFNIMYRLLARAAEVAAQPGMSESVKVVYDEVVAPHATAFCKSHEAVVAAESAMAAARRQFREDMAVFDSPCRAVRSVVLAYFPGYKLPDTLKAQPTDTDRLNAVTTLLSTVQSHASEPWAAALLKGPFGTLAPKVIATLQQLVATATALAEARQQRANAQKPAYEKLVAFRRVVRDTLGATSMQYRRLRLRARSTSVEDAEEAAPESGVVPSTQTGTATQTSGPTSVKVA